MATYVLVHGGWSGAHGFRHVRRRLQRAGHDVFTPCLTGIGERVHLASPQVNLTTHVHDLVNHILYEDLVDVILLGFSYGGFVVASAISHIADRVAHVVFLDAFVPSDGETPLAHVVGIDPAPITLGENPMIPPPDREYDDPAEAAWMTARRVPHPTACFTEPVHMPRPLEDYPFGRTYVKATRVPPTDLGADALWRAATHAKESPAWEYREIETTHMVPSNRPDELADLLLALG